MNAAAPPPRRQPPSGFSWSAPAPPPEALEALLRRFPEVLRIPDSAIDSDYLAWSDSGLIARSLGGWVPPEAIIRELRRSAVAGDVTVIPTAHRCYLVRLDSPTSKEFVLANPWTVNGSPLALANWRPDFTPATDAISQAVIWVRLPDLPIEYWGDAALRLIAAPAGEFLFADQCTAERRRGGFARVCVRVNLSLPLRPGVRLQGRGSPRWQQFSYENLQGICPLCGSLHISGSCSAPPESSSSASASCFGPWMAAVRQRSVPQVPRSSPPASAAPPPAARAPGGDGWSTPKRTTRRRVLPQSFSVSPTAGGNEVPAPSSVATGPLVFTADKDLAPPSVRRGSSSGLGRMSGRGARASSTATPPLRRSSYCRLHLPPPPCRHPCSLLAPPAWMNSAHLVGIRHLLPDL